MIDIEFVAILLDAAVCVIIHVHVNTVCCDMSDNDCAAQRSQFTCKKRPSHPFPTPPAALLFPSPITNKVTEFGTKSDLLFKSSVESYAFTWLLAFHGTEVKADPTVDQFLKYLQMSWQTKPGGKSENCEWLHTRVVSLTLRCCVPFQSFQFVKNDHFSCES